MDSESSAAVSAPTYKKYEKAAVLTVCPDKHSIYASDYGGAGRGGGDPVFDLSVSGVHQKDVVLGVRNHSSREIHFQLRVDMFSLVRGGERFFTLHSSPWRTCAPSVGKGVECYSRVKVPAPPVFGELINTDIIKIYAHAKIIKASSACPGPPELAEEQENVMNEDLANGFFEPEYTDFNLVSQGKKIPCHRMILACRSKKFKDILLPDSKEADLKEYEVKDSSPKAIRDLLYFVYTNKLLDLRSGPLIDLLDLARRFHVYSLEEKCSESLVACLHESNALQVAEVARDMGLRRLRAKSVQFLVGEGMQKADIRRGVVEAGKEMLNEVIPLLAARANCGDGHTKRLQQFFPRRNW